MRKYIVGDIRGELTLLKKLMDKLGPVDSDCFVFLGSYLGPGNDSRGVLDYLLDFKKKFPNTSFLKGCYEWMFGFCIETKPSYENQKLWGQMQGINVFQSYSDDKKLVVTSGKGPISVEMPLKVPATHLEFMATSLHHWYEDDIFPYVACHSGGHPILYGGELQNEQQIVFGENGWWKQDGRRIPGKTVIFSHVPFTKPFRRGGKLGIDLGAGLGGKLAAFEMFSEQIHIVG